MKIIHVVESFAGGVYDFLVDLTLGMPKDEHVIIYTTREHTPKDFEKMFSPQTQFIKWPNATREINPKADILALVQLIKILKDFPDADAIHLHSSKAGFLGRIAARWLGMGQKVLYTPHGVSFLRQDVSPFKHKIFVYLEKLGAFFGGKVIGCSQSEAEAFHPYGIDAQYVNNGIKCEQLDSKSHTASEETIKVGTIGRITYPKNPELFNHIAERFVDDHRIEFLWIGDGELGHLLTASNIRKTGWLNRNDVETELNGIDIYLSTSLWEGLPLSVLQAMCASKPLLLSDCVGNRDLVQDEINGKIFNNLDEGIRALTELLEQHEKRVLMGQRSRELLAQEFSIEQMINGYMNLYQSLKQSNRKA